MRVEVLTLLHHEDDAPELEERKILARPELVLHEERANDVVKMLEFPDAIGHTVAMVLANHANTEVRLDRMQNLNIVLVLDDCEFR